MRKLLILISIISFSNLCFGQAVTVQNNELKYRIPSGQVRTAANKDSLIALKNLFYTFLNHSSSPSLPDSNGVVSPSIPIGSFSGGITKEMIGLGNVNNTSDLSKPISTATQYALNLKQNVLISGTNIKTIEGGTILGPGNIDITKANIGLDSVQNVNTTNPSNIIQKSTHRFTTDAEKTTWNGKESVLTFSSPLSRSTNTISIPVATSSVSGYLSSTDWSTFNSKFATPSGLTTNYLTKWNGGLVNSLIYENGTNVGIGTTIPGSLLDIRGQISASLGSLANPAYSFVGDLNTGIYSPSADALALVTGGVNRLHINSSGNVGVGVSNQNRRLHISPSSLYSALNTGDGIIISNTSLTSADLILGIGGGIGGVVQSRVSGGTGSWPLLLNPFGGNVGIGTTSPLFDLQIGGTNANRVLRISAGTGGSNTSIIKLGTVVREWDIKVGASPYNLSFDYVGTDTPISNILTLLKGGNVGISIATPTQKLDVNGTTQSTAFKLSANNTAPATSTTACTVGEIRIDGNYFFYCSGTNTWKRAELTTF